MSYRAERSNLRVAVLCVTLIAAAACSDRASRSSQGSSKFFGFPKDAVFVAGSSWKALVKTGAFQQLDIAKSLLSPEYARFKKLCGIDVLTDIDRVMTAGTAVRTEGERLTIIEGSIDREQAASCHEKLVGKPPEKRGALIAYNAYGEETYGYWLDSRRVLYADSESVLSKAVSRRSNVEDNAQMNALLRTVDQSAHLWVVGRLPDRKPRFFPLDPMPSGLYVSLNYDSDFQATVGLRYDSDKIAKQQVAAVDGLFHSSIPPAFTGAKQVVEEREVTAHGTDVIAKLRMTENQLMKLAPLMMSAQ